MSTLYQELLEDELRLARGALAEGGTHRAAWLRGQLAGREGRMNSVSVSGGRVPRLRLGGALSTREPGNRAPRAAAVVERVLAVALVAGGLRLN